MFPIAFSDGFRTVIIRLENLYIGLVKAAIKKPSLVPIILGSAWAFRSNRWYLRPPFLPIPPKKYMRWRMNTAYGDTGVVPPTIEVERYLRWASDMRKLMRTKTLEQSEFSYDV